MSKEVKKETVEVTVSEYNTIEPHFKKFGGTSGYLKYFNTKAGTKLKITIEEIKE